VTVGKPPFLGGKLLRAKKATPAKQRLSVLLVARTGFEPVISALRGRCPNR
jgi:hypothetical protein